MRCSKSIPSDPELTGRMDMSQYVNPNLISQREVYLLV
jgi:hypothetical protein